MKKPATIFLMLYFCVQLVKAQQYIASPYTIASAGKAIESGNYCFSFNIGESASIATFPSPNNYFTNGFEQYEYCIPTGMPSIVDGNQSGIFLQNNPASDFAILFVTDGRMDKIKNITVHDTQGRLVHCHITTLSNIKVDVSNLASGMYIISLNKNLETFNFKFIKP